MDNKKIIIFIIGLSLIIIGLIGWSCFDRANNQNKKITEESAVYDEGVNKGVNRGVNRGVNSGVTADDAQSAAENTSSAEHVQKKTDRQNFFKSKFAQNFCKDVKFCKSGRI